MQLTVDGEVGGLSHVVTAVKPAEQLSVVRDDEHSRRHRVHSHNVSLAAHCQPGHNVYVSEHKHTQYIDEHTLV